MHDVQARSYSVIRAALLAGVLIFGGACWFIVSRNPPAAPSGAVDVLALAFAALALATTGGFLVVRRLIARARPEQRAALTIAGWALGEAPALLGGVNFLLTGRPLLYLVGTGLLLVAFVLFPIREDG